MNKQAYVYILASRKNGTLYTGVTSDLVKRMYQHKAKINPDSFTAKYSVNQLVWYVSGDDISSAIELEKKIKNRNRAWKITLIEKTNPEWNDLSVEFMSCDSAQDDNDYTQHDSNTPVIPREAKRSRGIHGSCDYAQDDSSSAQDDGSFTRDDNDASPVMLREVAASIIIQG